MSPAPPCPETRDSGACSYRTCETRGQDEAHDLTNGRRWGALAAIYSMGRAGSRE